MDKNNTELKIGLSEAVIEPDENGNLPTTDELKELLGDDDAYYNDFDLQADRDAAIQAGTRRRVKQRVTSRLASERKKLDEQVQHMAATDPRSRDTNPYLTKELNQQLQREKAETELNIQALEQAKDALNLSASTVMRQLYDGQPLSSRAAILVQDGIKPEVARLLASLNMNLDIALNGKQTEMLMTALLSCNEQQIKAILNNSKVPIAVKLMAKRLQDDLKAGSTTALEGLWDRIFGKGILDIKGQAAEYKRSLTASAKSQSAPPSPTQQTVIAIGGDLPHSNGIAIRGEDANRLLHDAALPSQPLSREAYLMIREHFAPLPPDDRSAANTQHVILPNPDETDAEYIEVPEPLDNTKVEDLL